MIYETAIYCGSQKVWRVLNLNTATVYSMEYETQEEALDSIEDGVERCPGEIVKRVFLANVRLAVAFAIDVSLAGKGKKHET